MISRPIKAGAVAAIVAVAAYWYWSPLLAVRQMQSAAQNRDADAFNEHVNYPKLRENIKGQFSAMFTDKLSAPTGSHSALALAGATFGAKLGMVMVNQFVDTMLRPDTVMLAMRDGRFPRSAKQSNGTATPADGQTAAAPKSAGGDKPKWVYERQGPNRVIAYSTAAEDESRGKFTFVLQRSGFATWKLTEVLLPALNNN